MYFLTDKYIDLNVLKCHLLKECYLIQDLIIVTAVCRDLSQYIGPISNPHQYWMFAMLA